MIAASFRLIRKFLQPRWLNDGEGELVGYSLDLVKDAFIERLRLGHLAKYPQNDPSGETTAPPDSLAAMGRDRRVIRGIFDTDATYAAKLVRYLDDRRRCGNPLMIMQKLAEYCGPLPSFRIVDVRGNWYSRAADGTESVLLNEGNWDWDGDTSRWSRFWVLVYPNGLWGTESTTWGDPADSVWGSDPTTDMLGITATQEHVASLKFIVNDWKPAGTRCSQIIFAFDPTSFDPSTPEPDGEWGHWGKVDTGVRVPSRLDTARYTERVDQ